MEDSANKEKVVCPLCGENISKEKFKYHMDAEKYVLDMIENEHPDWKEADGGCQKCLEYYKKM